MPPIPPQIYCELLLWLKTATADRRRGRKDVTGDPKCFHGAEHVNPSASASFWNHITREFEVILTVRLKPWAFLVLTMLPSCQVCGAHMDDRWEDLIPNVIKLFHSRLSPARFPFKDTFLFFSGNTDDYASKHFLGMQRDELHKTGHFPLLGCFLAGFCWGTDSKMHSNHLGCSCS